MEQGKAYHSDLILKGQITIKKSFQMWYRGEPNLYTFLDQIVFGLFPFFNDIKYE